MPTVKIVITIVALLTGITLHAQWSAPTVVSLAALGSPANAEIRIVAVEGVGLLEAVPDGNGYGFTLIRPMAGWYCREATIAGFGVTDYQIRDVNGDGRDDLIMTATVSGTVMLWYNTGWNRCR